MFIHLIALAKFEGQSLAYHYASLNPEDILAKQRILRDVDSVSATAYSVHVLKTDCADFASVQTMDAYFADTKVYADIEPFFAALSELGQVTSADIAAYLLGLGDWQSGALQRLMYNIYADHLMAYRQPLFRATFTAGDQGPVDKCTVGRQLPPSYELAKKIMAGTAASNILEEVDSGVQKYHVEFDWDGPNPTHNPDSPWQVARARDGQNAVITDSDILKHHQAEKI